ALLSWFELAAFTVVRADCCPGAEPVKVPAVGQCEPLDASLNAVAEAATHGGDVDGALKTMHRAIGCILASGAAGNYPFAPLTGGEETAFRKTLARVASHHP